MKSALMLTSGFLAISSPVFSAEESTGSLSVDKNIVRQEGIPTLEWNISRPATKITDIITIGGKGEEDNDAIIAKKKLRVQVFVVGVGITDGRNEYKSTSSLNFSSVGWKHIFEGVGSRVNTSKVYIDRIIEKDEKIEFKARYYWRSWQPYYYNHGDNVKALVNGDTPPSKTGGYEQSSLNDYLKPYVKDGKLNIGPYDVIYAAELTHSDPSKSGFDMQDTIILLRFTEVK